MKGASARKRFKILFLCTGNSARSILAEFFLKTIQRIGVEIYRRLGLFTALPLESLDRLRLEEMTKAVGKKSTVAAEVLG